MEVLKVEEILNDPDILIGLLKAYEKEKAKVKALTELVAVQAQRIAELKTKTDYYDVILSCEEHQPTSQISKDYGWPESRMNAFLEKQGILYQRNNLWLVHREYSKRGYAKREIISITDKSGTPHRILDTCWTQKGRLFIYELMKAAGFLPLIEKGE